jgi:hypothetical protein
MLNDRERLQRMTATNDVLAECLKRLQQTTQATALLTQELNTAVERMEAALMEHSRLTE